MLAPLSWLSEFIDIKQKPEILGEKLTEVGLGTEKITKLPDQDFLFEFEITPNRPDLLCILGIAREIAAIENKKVNYKMPEIGINSKDEFPIKIINDYSLCPRYSAIVIRNVEIKDSPDFIQKRLKKMNLRPICNLVDITNYVMLELGNPLHAFDYDKIGGQMKIQQEEKEGEEFVSLDEKKYRLNKGAIIIRDNKQTVIDLCGIKGGLNSAVDKNTRNILIHVPIYPGFLIRKTSQALSISSDASKIYERGANSGGTIETLNRAVELVLKYAGGEIASSVIDLKEKDFKEWKITIDTDKLTQVLGKELSEKQIRDILERLNLKTKNIKTKKIEVTIPTYRGDLKIEEDIYEEVARLFGYNNFPKTIPTVTNFPIQSIPYSKNYKLEEKVKNILTGCSFNEIYTYSLISEKDLDKIGQLEKNILRIDNPVSKEFEYLRPDLSFGLINAIISNQTLDKNFKGNFFELGRVYEGKNIKNYKESDHIGFVSNEMNFRKFKGVVERMFQDLALDEKIEYKKLDKQNVLFGQNKSSEILYDGKQIGKIGIISFDTIKRFLLTEDILYTELDYLLIEQLASNKKIYKPVPKFPPIFEDINISCDQKITFEQIEVLIKKQSTLISEINLIDTYQNKKTFRVTYQDFERNLTNEDVTKIREQIYTALEKDLKAKIT